MTGSDYLHGYIDGQHVTPAMRREGLHRWINGPGLSQNYRQGFADGWADADQDDR